AVLAAAERGDAEAALVALDRHRLLCAHRDGPYGVHRWNRATEAWLAEEAGVDHWPLWYAGRPLIVTSNDYAVGVYNGETGVVVRRADGALRARVAGSDGVRDLATTRLVDVDTMHALTIHKSQGSQVDEVTVLLPPPESRLLSRELFYTAVTRARSTVRVVGSEATVRAAVTRQAQRASGLARRLAHPSGDET
ncbi:MAG: ATP-binding domain-containing protein, partial [Nocardioides sp.]